MKAVYEVSYSWYGHIIGSVCTYGNKQMKGCTCNNWGMKTFIERHFHNWIIIGPFPDE